jgi:hypothetical protein
VHSTHSRRCRLSRFPVLALSPSRWLGPSIPVTWSPHAKRSLPLPLD